MTRGTAPEMTPDLREIIQRVAAARPDVEWWQVWVSHPADDDGLWAFQRRGEQYPDVQIESSRGVCPFLVEGGDNIRRTGATPEEVASIVLDLIPKASGLR